MSNVVLFHHAQGLTTGVTEFTDRLRAAGHMVHTRVVSFLSTL